MTPDEQTATMLQVSCMLREPDLREEYLMVSADLALYAKDRGSPGEIDDFMRLMIAAADRSALSAAFDAAKRFLDGYESELLHRTSPDTDFRRHRTCRRAGHSAQDFPSRLLSIPQTSSRSVWSAQAHCRGRGQGESTPCAYPDCVA